MIATHLVVQKRALAEKAANRRLLASIPLAKGLRRSTARVIAEREVELAQKKLALKDKLRRRGLAGQRLGKHKVPEEQVEVQLGEDLTESLRGLKVSVFRPTERMSYSMAFDSPKGISSVIDS